MGNARKAKDQRRAAREAAASMTFWHGGVAGLQVGDHILSPDVTRDPSSVSQHMAIARADRVYFTTDRELARAYAAIVFEAFESSGLYRVQPVGQFEIDPDYPTVGFQSRKALILEVAEQDVQLSLVERTLRSGPYETWDDGRPMYDADGRLQASRLMEAHGITQAKLDATVGPWTTPEEIAAHLGGQLPPFI